MIQQRGLKTLFSIFLLIIFIVSCASALKDKSELGEAPEKMKQKIEEPAPEQIVVAPTLTESSQASSKATVIEKKTKQSQKKLKQKTPIAVKVSKTKIVEEPVPSQEAFAKEWPFGVGEKATYVIRYGPLEGGKATIEVAPLVTLDGEVALHYVARARSHKVFDLFYRIEDTLESWVRLKDHQPLRQEIEQNESGEWGRRVVIFNQKLKEQHFYSSTTRPGKETKVIDEKHPLYSFPQDLFGSYFFGRFVKDPQKINFPVHDRFKHWNNEYKFEEKEEVKTKAGTFMCNRYRVYPRVQGKLEPQGDAIVWLTDDHRRFMTKFKVKIKIGSVTGDLVAYEAGTPWNMPIPKFTTPLNLDPSKKYKVQ